MNDVSSVRGILPCVALRYVTLRCVTLRSIAIQHRNECIENLFKDFFSLVHQLYASGPA